ncbi:MAG: HU family DNA-binding protein [Halioglobus sp.]|nr:HU family DNA-binding protein [Halioglobus sp.]
MATKRKAAKKKAPARKKAAAKKAPAKKVVTTAISDKMTKGQIVASLADTTELSKKQVSEVLDAYENLIARSIKKRGVGEFTMPGLMKITTKKKPAVKARKGINPFTKEEQMFKAKPASMQVKVRALKKMKEFAAS